MGLSLIVSIGAQNAFVLRQGIRRQHVALVVCICALSDVVLIAVGVAGFGTLIAGTEWILQIARFGGAACLLVFGALALKRAVRPAALTAAEEPTTRGSGATAAALTVLGLTWLNPQVYLETIVLLGSVATAQASQHGDAARWAFGGGAMIASVAWFTALGAGARLLQPLFARPAAWRVLDAVVAAMMFTLATLLLIRPL
ncbi:LysE/ArgO family amino acid transporter [Zhihengliuella flava]|nr:LysE/ArgO family amino acid transporter [Zhihengliuella flava]